MVHTRRGRIRFGNQPVQNIDMIRMDEPVLPGHETFYSLTDTYKLHHTFGIIVKLNVDEYAIYKRSIPLKSYKKRVILHRIIPSDLSYPSVKR